MGEPTRICRFGSGAAVTALPPAGPDAFTPRGEELVVEVQSWSLKEEDGRRRLERQEVTHSLFPVSSSAQLWLLHLLLPLLLLPLLLPFVLLQLRLLVDLVDGLGALLASPGNPVVLGGAQVISTSDNIYD